jgi:hypothetical protein
VWTLDSFLGYVHSTSIVAAIMRGATGFEPQLRAAVLAHDPVGWYPETLLFSTIRAATR